MNSCVRVVGVRFGIGVLLVYSTVFSALSSAANTAVSNREVQLANGVAQHNLSSRFDEDLWFKIKVPDGVHSIKFEVFGGTGDADMYVKRGYRPTDDDWDCRPMLAGNDEQCKLDNAGGVYFVRLKSYVGYTALSLRVSFNNLPQSIQRAIF